MLYLNNQLLTSDRIISFFESNVLLKVHPSSSKAPSPLSQLKNKLKSIFFEDVVGSDLVLMSLPTGEIDRSILSQTMPMLIKQGADYFIYGNTDGKNWKLTKLDRDVMEQANLNFPPIGALRTVLSYSWQYHRIYENIRMKEGLLTFHKRPSDDAMREVILMDSRFTSNYPFLKKTLTTIFSLSDTDNQFDALHGLKTSHLIDWNVDSARVRFQALNTAYGYFDAGTPEDFRKLLSLFIKLAEACRTIIVLFERNNNLDDTLAYEYAYKLMALFVDQSDLSNTEKLFDAISQDAYKLLNQSDSKKGRPFHDVLLVGLQLPAASDITDRAGWKKFIQKEGCKAFFFLSMAEKMEQKIAEQVNEHRLRAPKDLLEAQSIAKLCRYSHAEEDLAFAELCYSYKVSERRFNRCLNYLSSGWPKKSGDLIPDVIIKGQDEAAGYYWVKLPVADKRALILGDMTMCCQSIGGASEVCVKDAVSLPNNGLYVLLRQRSGCDPAPIVEGNLNNTNFDIVGQAYVWKSNTGNICLDSIECLNSVSSPTIYRILTDFATRVLHDDPTIKRVTLGRGGKTPDGLFSETLIAEKMRQGIFYGDAKTQYCIGKTPYFGLDETQGFALYSLSHSFCPWDKNFLEFRECMDYLSYYMADTTRFIEQLQTLFSTSWTFASTLTPRHLNILITLNNHLTIEDFKPVDFGNLDKLNQQQKNIERATITTARLVWTALINPQEISRLIEYVPQHELAEVVKAMDIYGENKALIHHLSAAQHRALYGIVKDKLPELINSASEFAGAMESLDPGHCTRVCEGLSGKLFDIMTALDFGQTISRLSEEKRTAIGLALKDKLPELINSAQEYYGAVFFLNPPERADVYVGMKNKLFEIIKSGRDFCFILDALNFEMRTDFCIEYVDKLSDELMKSSAVFNHMMKYLPLPKRDEFFQVWIVKLPQLIKSGNEVNNAICHLSLEHRSTVYEALKDKIPTLIKSSVDFNRVLSQLLPEQRAAIFESMKDRLSSLINSVVDFYIVRQVLLPEQNAAIYETMKAELPALVKPFILKSSPGQKPYKNLSDILMWFSSDEFAYIFQELKDVLPLIIQSGKDFLNVLWDCQDSKHSGIIFEMMKEVLPELLKTQTDYEEALNYLSMEEGEALYEILKDKLPQIIKPNFLSVDEIKSVEDFSDLIKKYPDKERATLYASVKDKLPDWINSPCDMRTALTYLSNEQRIDLYEAVIHKLPLIVKSVLDYTSICMNIESAEEQMIYNALKNYLPDMIRSIKDFESMVRVNPSRFPPAALLNEEQRNILYESIKERLPDLVRSGGEVARIMSLLSSDKRAILYEAIKNKLPILVQCIDDFVAIMEHLNEQQRVSLYNAVKHQLPAMMRQTHDLSNALCYLPAEFKPGLIDAVKLHHLITEMGSVASNKEVTELANALIAGNSEAIKKQINHIIEQYKPSKSCLWFLFIPNPALLAQQLINVLSGLESTWLKKINSALELHLTNEQLDVQQEVKNALKDYVTSNINQSVAYPFRKLQSVYSDNCLHRNMGYCKYPSINDFREPAISKGIKKF